MHWIGCHERYPATPDDSYGFCLESVPVLIQTAQGEHYTARYRILLDDNYEQPDPDQVPCWILEGQDGYNLALEVVVAWLPIEPYRIS